MDLIVPKKDLLRLATRCQGVADKKSAMPMLADVLLSAKGKRLFVAATDLYLGISGDTACDIATEGSVAVPAKDLVDRVKAMPDGPIQLLTNEAAQMTLKSVGNPRRYMLHGIPGTEFPQLPKPTEGAQSLELPASMLAWLIAGTVFSISSDETRPNVNSGLFEWMGDTIRMVSTDGHRLSKAEATIVGLKANATMLIPLKAIGELRRLAEEARTDKDAPTVKVTQSQPNAFFEIAGMTFSVKLVDAQFPPYQQVIPAKSDNSIVVPRAALRDALKAISLAANEETGGVKLTASSGTLRITSESPESGNGFDELSVDYNGPELTIGFNAKYVLDILDAIEADEVSLGVSGELDPMVVRPGAESEGHAYLGVCMPLRL